MVILTQEQFSELQKTQSIRLIDVREPWEHALHQIPGSINIPWEDLATCDLDVLALEPEMPVILYCKSGVRSEKGIHLLQDRGVQNLYNLQGGILAWEQAKIEAEC